MRHGLKALALVVLLAGPMAANAVPFVFSYDFGGGNVVTGTLNGDQNGQYVENVTDITVSLNGVQFNGPLYFSSFCRAAALPIVTAGYRLMLR